MAGTGWLWVGAGPRAGGCEWRVGDLHLSFDRRSGSDSPTRKQQLVCHWMARSGGSESPRWFLTSVPSHLQDRSAIWVSARLRHIQDPSPNLILRLLIYITELPPRTFSFPFPTSMSA